MGSVNLTYMAVGSSMFTCAVRHVEELPPQVWRLCRN